MADLAGIGRLDLSVFEHQRIALADINTPFANSAERHGGFTNGWQSNRTSCISQPELRGRLVTRPRQGFGVA